MLAWEVGDDWNGESLEPVKAPNPASWITVDGLVEQREAVADVASPAVPLRPVDSSRQALAADRGVGRSAPTPRFGSTPASGSSR
jgi:hypothetical protein